MTESHLVQQVWSCLWPRIQLDQPPNPRYVVCKLAAMAHLSNKERPAPNVVQPKPRQDVEAAPRAEEHSAPDVARPSKHRQDVEAASQEDVVILDDSDSGDPTPFIKSGIIQLVRKYSLIFCLYYLTSYLGARGVDTTKLRGANFPWKTLLAFLVEKGLIMEGYPHDVLMPGEKQSATSRMKGLNSLTLPQKRILASSLHAKQVTLRKVADSRELGK